MPLVKRCIREYGWSNNYAARVLDGYKNFLRLKQDLSDWDHKILSPSIPVDKMWHMHILDVANYIKDCELLCGHLVGHDPDGMLDTDARKRRVETTRHILQNQLGRDLDEEVWNFGGSRSDYNGGNNKLEAGVSPDRKRRREDENTGRMGTSGSDKRKKAANAREKITIRLKDGNGEETDFKIWTTTPMRKVLKAYCDQKGISAPYSSNYRLLLDCERVGDDQTARTLELEDGDQFDVIVVQVGC